MKPTPHRPAPQRRPAPQAARMERAGHPAPQRGAPPDNPRPAAGEAALPEVAVVAVLGYN